MASNFVPMAGEVGMLDQGDGGSDGGITHICVFVTQEGGNGPIERGAVVPKGAHFGIVGEVVAVEAAFADGKALVIGIVDK